MIGASRRHSSACACVRAPASHLPLLHEYSFPPRLFCIFSNRRIPFGAKLHIPLSPRSAFLSFFFGLLTATRRRQLLKKCSRTLGLSLPSCANDKVTSLKACWNTRYREEQQLLLRTRLVFAFCRSPVSILTLLQMCFEEKIHCQAQKQGSSAILRLYIPFPCARGHQARGGNIQKNKWRAWWLNKSNSAITYQLR